MPVITFTEADLILARTPDEDLLVGIDPIADGCDGSVCGGPGAPDMEMTPHSHLVFSAPGLDTSYPRFVQTAPTTRP